MGAAAKAPLAGAVDGGGGAAEAGVAGAAAAAALRSSRGEGAEAGRGGTEAAVRPVEASSLRGAAVRMSPLLRPESAALTRLGRAV